MRLAPSLSELHHLSHRKILLRHLFLRTGYGKVLPFLFSLRIYYRILGMKNFCLSSANRLSDLPITNFTLLHVTSYEVCPVFTALNKPICSHHTVLLTRLKEALPNKARILPNQRKILTIRLIYG